MSVNIKAIVSAINSGKMVELEKLLPARKKTVSDVAQKGFVAGNRPALSGKMQAGRGQIGNARFASDAKSLYESRKKAMVSNAFAALKAFENSGDTETAAAIFESIFKPVASVEIAKLKLSSDGNEKV